MKLNEIKESIYNFLQKELKDIKISNTRLKDEEHIYMSLNPRRIKYQNKYHIEIEFYLNLELSTKEKNNDEELKIIEALKEVFQKQIKLQNRVLTTNKIFIFKDDNKNLNLRMDYSLIVKRNEDENQNEYQKMKTLITREEF
ncbi:MAG: hypothetical protein N4A54_00450 [Peptostreptococcaceae bacterium]|jgi:hypothetical protein|nr:hypothetical protein [Peptostreptococcaceae bacterium]